MKISRYTLYKISVLSIFYRVHFSGFYPIEKFSNSHWTSHLAGSVRVIASLDTKKKWKNQVYWKYQEHFFKCQNNAEKACESDFHIAPAPISQNYFFEEVWCLILASSQRKLSGYIKFLKFDVTVKTMRKFKFV